MSKKNRALQFFTYVISIISTLILILYCNTIVLSDQTIGIYQDSLTKRVNNLAALKNIQAKAIVQKSQIITPLPISQTINKPEEKPIEEKPMDKAHAWLSAMQKCQGIHKITTHQKVVALTFDDGPNGQYTEEILRILKKHHIRGTFFLIGENALRYPNLVRQLFLDQNVLGNHTYSHPYVSKLPIPNIQNELIKNSAIIYNIVGAVPAVFRPPYGVCSDNSRVITKQLGYKTILWSATTDDYSPKKVSGEEIASDILQLVYPGSIITLHDGGGPREKTVAALEIIINTLEKHGYQFVTIPELLNIPPYQLVVVDHTIHRTYIENKKSDLVKYTRLTNRIVSESSYSHLNVDPYNLDAILKERLTTPDYIITRDGIVHRLAWDTAINKHLQMNKILSRQIDATAMPIQIEILNTEKDTPTREQEIALDHLTAFLRNIPNGGIH